MHAQTKSMQYVNSWNDNGRGIFSVLKDYRMALTDTFGPTKKPAFTWVNPCGTRHRIDYVIAQLRVMHSVRAYVDYDSTLSLGGDRDRFPVVMVCCGKAHFRPGSASNIEPKVWDREALVHACDSLG